MFLQGFFGQNYVRVSFWTFETKNLKQDRKRLKLFIFSKRSKQMTSN
jgi:hypothetical protein